MWLPWSPIVDGAVLSFANFRAGRGILPAHQGSFEQPRAVAHFRRTVAAPKARQPALCCAQGCTRWGSRVMDPRLHLVREGEDALTFPFGSSCGM